MISRAARVPRICLACRFGLTQRSAVLGFRAAPIAHSLGQRRRYTSEIGKTGDGKIEGFITGANTPSETKSKKEESSERTESATKQEETASELKDSSKTETTSDATPAPQDNKNAEPTTNTQFEPPSIELPLEKSIDPVQETRDGTLDQASTPASRLDPSEEKPDSSTEQSADSSEDVMFEIPTLPELEPTALPTKRFRHDLVHDASLGVSALGVPADAIIINNPNQLRRSKKAPTVVDSQPVQPPSEVDWQYLDPEEKGEDPSVDEICLNIDEFRPDVRLLRDTDIEQLTATLCDGFTADQLKEYIRLRPDEAADYPDIANYSWIVEQVPWSPSPPRVRGQGKLGYAQKIIFDKWKIEEYVDVVGKLIVEMDPKLFVFLTFDSERIVRELRKDFLVGEEERMTLVRKQHHIHISARKATAYGILARLDQILQPIQTRMIPIQNHVLQVSFQPAELKVLGDITKTSLQLVKEDDGEKLRVSWLPDPQENMAESKTEDPADVVLRLILGRPSTRANMHLECLPWPLTRAVPRSYFVDMERQVKALTWREKLVQWRRIVFPIKKTPRGDQVRQTLVGMVNAASLPEYGQELYGWRNVTTATFGHIIHSRTGASQGSAQKKPPPIQKRSKKPHKVQPSPWHCDPSEHHVPISTLARKSRTFSPLVPHPASFSALRPEDDKPLTQSTTIILNLAPYADRSATNKKGPPIRIRLPVTPEADLTNFSIPKDASAHGVVTWHTNDLMLPGKSVDVRFQHERILPLDISQSDGLKSFLDQSEFNLLQGHLRTPSQVNIKVPIQWFNPATRVDGGLEVRYAFRGLEIHQTTEMPWRGHTLRYSSIEAGQHGGQRQELTLQAGSSAGENVSLRADERDNFLRLVDEMAAGRCFSWAEGHESIKSRQLQDHSYDLPEAELTEDIIVEDDNVDEDRDGDGESEYVERIPEETFVPQTREKKEKDPDAWKLKIGKSKGRRDPSPKSKKQKKNREGTPGSDSIKVDGETEREMRLRTLKEQSETDKKLKELGFDMDEGIEMIAQPRLKFKRKSVFGKRARPKAPVKERDLPRSEATRPTGGSNKQGDFSESEPLPQKDLHDLLDGYSNPRNPLDRSQVGDRVSSEAITPKKADDDLFTPGPSATRPNTRQRIGNSSKDPFAAKFAAARTPEVPGQAKTKVTRRARSSSSNKRGIYTKKKKAAPRPSKPKDAFAAAFESSVSMKASKGSNQDGRYRW
ncbi:hypothetical protein ACHAPT_012726 [Fusarium lateritium]